MDIVNPISEHLRLPEDCAVVACGALRREMRYLSAAGFVPEDRLFFTAPGLHEWPERLKEQLVSRLARARRVAKRVIVAYGEKCYLDADAGLDTSALLAQFGPGAARVPAKNCVDMLVSGEERERLAKGEKVYWFTAGWIEHWDFIFKDWDAAKANETFPVNDKGIVLDGTGYFEETSRTNPEKILRICDWAKLPLEPHGVSLERLRSLLGGCAQGMALRNGERAEYVRSHGVAWNDREKRNG